MHLRVFAALFALLASARPGYSAEHWVDPQASVANPDGSRGAPWPSLQHLIEADLIERYAPVSYPHTRGAPVMLANPGAPIRPGDTIWLMGGRHGGATLRGYHNDPPIHVRAAPEEAPALSQLHLQGSSGWRFEGLSVSPEHAVGGRPERAQALVFVESHAWHGPSFDVEVVGCEVFTALDTRGWGASDWVTGAYDAIVSQGEDVRIVDNRLHDVRFGVQVHGERTEVIGNQVLRFSGDGLRAIASHGRYEGNEVAFAYAVDDNHDDGFQAWSLGEDGRSGTGVIRDVVVRGNRFVHFDPQDDRMRGNFQGIGCFDGFCDEFVIENNVVVVDSWHGITLAGTRDSRVVNNTIVAADSASERIPGVWIRPHKDGRPSARVLVRNNLTPTLTPGSNAVADHNLTYEDPTLHFVDAPAFDFHLRASSGAVDQGSSASAPEHDLEGVARPQGAAVDIGAYERVEAPSPPFDAGVEPPDAGAPPPPDAGSVAERDGGLRPDSGVRPRDAGVEGPAVDAGGAPGPEALVDDGCTTSSGATPLAVLLLLGLLRRRG